MVLVIDSWYLCRYLAGFLKIKFMSFSNFMSWRNWLVDCVGLLDWVTEMTRRLSGRSVVWETYCDDVGDLTLPPPPHHRSDLNWLDCPKRSAPNWLMGPNPPRTKLNVCEWVIGWTTLRPPMELRGREGVVLKNLFVINKGRSLKLVLKNRGRGNAEAYHSRIGCGVGGE